MPIVDALSRDSTAICMQPDRRLDYVFVDDAAEALTQLVLRRKVKGAVNIASGRGVPLLHLAKVAAFLMNLPESAVIAGRPARLDADVVGDNARAAGQLDWVPQTSLEIGLSKTIAWYQKKHCPTLGVA